MNFNFISISLHRQHDIGLERYNAKQLFLHLVTPTCIVIITVIQLHYCHQKFLEWSEIPEPPVDTTSKTSSVAYGTFIKQRVAEGDDDDDVDADDTEISTAENFLHDIKIRKLSRQEIKSYVVRFYKRALEIFIEWFEIGLLFVEIHAYKVMLFCAFLLAVNAVQLIHFAYVVIGVAGLKSKTDVQFKLTRVAALVSSFYVIITMAYQVKYVERSSYEANCTGSPLNLNETEVTNNADWIGLRKALSGSKLFPLLKPYLLYILLVSSHSIMILRQTIKRISENKPARAPTVVFKNIKRADADRDIPHLIKYLVNYGFYKFGIEICLIANVTVVGYRMDIVACSYACWLYFIYNLQREEARKIWNYMIIFILVSIPIQYLSLIGLPPSLCWKYPWNWDEVKFLRDFNIYSFLPQKTYEFKAQSELLLLDFVLLMLLCRQLMVFRIEARYETSTQTYPGGSNKSVLNEIDQLGNVPFDNPTNDFIDKKRNYLDILKSIVFVLFFWVALAITFLTGTSRVNILSVGYIVGAFVFLWQGTDFYLRPIHVIVQWWNYLIAYNVTVVVIKSVIQFVGCLLVRSEIANSVCWLIQVSFLFVFNFSI